VSGVERVGGGAVAFTQDAAGLHLRADDGAAGALPAVFRISGLHPR
jgi:hypothetical protein